MNEIQKERLAALEAAAKRMRNSDYQHFAFADSDMLIKLLRDKESWRKELKSEQIIQLIKDSDERKIAEANNKIIKNANDRIIFNKIKPLEEMIKIIELEMVLFSGIFGVAEQAEDIQNKV